MKDEEGKLFVESRFRHGKELRCDVKIIEDSGGGRRGRSLLVRIHPDEGASNSFGLVALRCNFDVQTQERLVALEGQESAAFAQQLIELIIELKTKKKQWPTVHDVATEAAEHLAQNTAARGWAHTNRVDETKARVECWLERANGSSNLFHAPLNQGGGTCNVALQTRKGTATAELRRVVLHFTAADDKGKSQEVGDADAGHMDVVTADLKAQLIEAARDGQDQSMYTSNYATKPGNVLKSRLERSDLE